MKLSTFKEHLNSVNSLTFILPNGGFVPQHFHITEVGQIHKKFIDCGGTIREEMKISFQLWENGEDLHRLAPDKLMKIISLSEAKLSLIDAEIEVEYQNQSIGLYGLEFAEGNFLLTSKNTACLAIDSCGNKNDVGQKANACCGPNKKC